MNTTHCFFSCQYSLVFFPGLIAGRLFDLGYFRLQLLLATFILVAATFLISECKEFWQFILCQGLAVGLSAGTIFGPTMGVISHWFKRRQGLALGFVTAGASLGGTVLPILIRNLIKNVGYASCHVYNVALLTVCINQVSLDNAYIGFDFIGRSWVCKFGVFPCVALHISEKLITGTCRRYVHDFHQERYQVVYSIYEPSNPCRLRSIVCRPL
jgi:MFS family permease